MPQIPTSSKLLGNGLTFKEQALVNNVIDQVKKTGTVNLTKAGKEAYPNANANSAKSMFGEVIKRKPLVLETIQEALKASGITLKKAGENVSKLANTTPEKISADVVLKANVEIFKLLNAYPKQQSAHINLNIDANTKGMSLPDIQKSIQEIAESSKVIN